MMNKSMILFGLAVVLCASWAWAEQSPAALDGSTPPSYVYVASSVVQIDSSDAFTSFTLTNTTPYWFNPQIYLIDLDGVIVRQFSPLLKGFGSWQKASSDLLTGDFQGSVWIISAQPIVASAFIYQYDAKAGSLTLLGNSTLERMTPDVASDIVQRVQEMTAGN